MSVFFIFVLQGDFKEQCKRKTILTTELPFPYIKKRIVVVSKTEVCAYTYNVKTHYRGSH